MNFTALLFCQDEKTARVTTQLLTELEFSVETSTEPFAAVKKLMAQHFDAVVVDCDNEQNASLLFKGARNSQLNQSSLAVAVVEGQAGVANAFRIGANLVLTKPINVEQAKGTLRVARGLLKKGGESAKASAPAPAVTPAAAPAPTPAPAPAATAPKPAAAPPNPIPPAPAVSKPVISAAPAKAMAAPVMAKPSTDNILDLDSDAEGAEENLLDLDEPKPSPRPELKTSMTPSSLLDAEQAAAKPAAPKRPTTTPVISSGGAASAPAPARVPANAPEFEKAGEPVRKPQPAAAAATSQVPMEAPGLFSQRSSAPTFGGLDAAEPESSGGAAKYAMIAVAVVALAAAGYFGYTKFHNQASAPAQTEQATAQPATAAPADVMPSAVVTAEAPARSKASVAEKPTPEVSASTSHKSDAVKPDESEPEVIVKNLEPEARVVKANPAAAPMPKAKEKEAEAEAPSVIGAAPGDQAAISNIVTSAPVSVPASAPPAEMLRVSQGVTQGLLLKRVQPVYPHSALQMRIGGSVQLQAVIGKTGAISSVKVTSGDPILAKAAIEAVKQWKYKPYLLDGDAVEIQTQITVNFKLP
jgi:protein TonB